MKRRAENDLMKDKAYLRKLEALTSDTRLVKYSLNMFRFLSKNFPKSRVIIDCGSGTGFNSKLLKDSFPLARVISVDYVEHNLSFGIKQGYISEGVLSDVYELSHRLNEVKDKVDLIFFGDVIEHLDKPQLALKNLIEVLAPGGLLVIHTPNLKYSKLFRLPEDPTHIHEYQPKEIRAEIQEAGFKVISIAPTGIPILSIVAPTISQYVGYSMLGRFLLRKLDFLGPSLIIIAKKNGDN